MPRRYVRFQPAQYEIARKALLKFYRTFGNGQAAHGK